MKFCVVPGAGIEPARCCQRGILSPVRLPIPPSRREPSEEGRIIHYGAPAEKCRASAGVPLP